MKTVEELQLEKLLLKEKIEDLVNEFHRSNPLAEVNIKLEHHYAITSGNKDVRLKTECKIELIIL